MKTIIALFVSLMSIASAAAVRGENYSYDLQKTFFVSGGGKLVVAVSSGDIQVKVWDKPQVQMTVQNIGDDADRVQTQQSGNTVTVQYRSHGGWWGSIKWGSIKDLRFVFYVPKNFNLDLSTSGGDVGISGEITGEVELSTSGGDLTIDEVNGKAEGRTSGGDIQVHDVENDASFSTSGGDISVDRAGGNLEISTSGGEISVGTVVKDLNASTAGGDIQIGNVGGELHAFTSSGDITVGKVGGGINVSTSGGDISLTTGNGRISANTSGGDINISNVTGSVEASSSGGTVKVGLTPKGGEGSRIESSGGDVYLYIPAEAKATIRIEISGGDSDDQVVSDFPVVTHGRVHGYGNEKAEIVLNGGGPEIYLYTSSGNVYVKKMNSLSK